MARLLIVDDEPDLAGWLAERLGPLGHDVATETDPQRAVERVAAEDHELVVMDVEMPRLRGIDAMAAMHRKVPGQLVILMTGFGTIELAVQGLQAGAADFVTKPFAFEQLRTAVDRALRERTMRRELVRLRQSRGSPLEGGLVARSPAMSRVVDVARKAARSGSTVLLLGESGVGKGALARAIHQWSPRAEGRFVATNCAALPELLVESELFGVKRGAFTDARADRPGRFEEAHGGTLFLDEVGELPLGVQPKLLQALESGTIRPLGAEGERAVDVRVVAATNVGLDEAVKAGRFRADLLWRLDVVRIVIPPLRERREDLMPLLDDLLLAASQRVGREILGFSKEALRWLLHYPWPGNVREMANLIERAVVLADHDTLVLQDFVGAAPVAGSTGEGLDGLAHAHWPLHRVEAEYIERVLALTGDNKAEAARILGIDRRTLYRHLAREEPAEG